MLEDVCRLGGAGFPAWVVCARMPRGPRTPASVGRVLSDLARLGLVEIIHRNATGDGRPTEYAITSRGVLATDAAGPVAVAPTDEVQAAATTPAARRRRHNAR